LDGFGEFDGGSCGHFACAELVVEGVGDARAEGEVVGLDVGDGVVGVGGKGAEESACADEDRGVWVAFGFVACVAWGEGREGREVVECAACVDTACDVVLECGDHALKRGREVVDALVEDEGASERLFAWWFEFEFEFEGHGYVRKGFVSQSRMVAMIPVGSLVRRTMNWRRSA
jgi:hypothetical protein